MNTHAPLAATPAVPMSETVRRANRPRAAAATPAVVHAAVNDSSRPLPASVRSLLENRFGASLSNVRIHDGAIAADAARKTGAQAFTVGSDIVFGAGQFDPHSRDGLDLIAHEVAHTIQQSGPGAASAPQLRATDGAPSSALEREADAAAHEAVQGTGPPGSAGALLRTRAGGPMLSRRAMKWTTMDGDAVDTVTGGDVTQWEYVTPQLAWFLVPRLRLPTEKGPALPQYKRATQAEGGSALTTQIGFEGSRTRAALKDTRASSEGLNRRWLEKVGWEAKEANENWYRSGGKKGTGFPSSNPGVTTSSCDIDHIVEMQLGGTNTLSNLTPLNSAENRSSGRQIWETVSGIAARLRPRLGDGNVVVGLVFADVYQDPEAAPPTACKGPGAADCSCVDVDACAMQKKAAPGGTREPYAVRTGLQEAEFKVPAGKAPVDLQDDENVYSAELVAGIVLETLHRSADQHQISGFVESKEHPKRRAKTRVPIELTEDQAKVRLDVLNTDGTRRLKLNGNEHPSVKFHYPYLSDGTMRLTLDEATGLSGTGTLRPSLPLLRNTKLDVELADGHFKGILTPQEAKNLRLPGGFTVTEPALTVELGPDLRADGGFKFHWGKLLTGTMTAQATPDDLKLLGTVNAAIPGLEQASGDVLYSHGEFSGKLTIATAQLANLPGQPQGTVTVDLDRNGVRPSGSILVTLPGGGDRLTLTVKPAPGRYGFIATASKTFPIKGLKDVELTVVYDGEHFGGATTTGVDYKGFSGVVKVKYWEGNWSGGGRVDVHVNKVTGWIELQIDDDGVPSGAGHATIPLTKTLTAGLGIEKPKAGPIRVTGDLELPPVIPVFGKRAFKYTLFDRSFPIPIWGPLILEITPSLGFEASVGPGEILNPKVTAGFNPFEKDGDFEFTAAATFNVPTYVGVNAGMGIGLGVDLKIGSATGGVKFIGGIGLWGNPNSLAFTLHYAKGVYDAKLEAIINQEIIAALDIIGYVKATALGSEIYRKDWMLYQNKWPTGWKLYIYLPLEYHSDRPFQLPDTNQMKIEFPSLSTDDVARSVKAKLGLT